MTRTVLHLLSQRPSRTGSGITVEALAHEAGAGDLAARLAPFTWAAVYRRVEGIWSTLLDA